MLETQILELRAHPKEVPGKYQRLFSKKLRNGQDLRLTVIGNRLVKVILPIVSKLPEKN